MTRIRKPAWVALAALVAFATLWLLVVLRVTTQADLTVLAHVRAAPGSAVASVAQGITRLGDGLPLVAVLVAVALLVSVATRGGSRPVVVPVAAVAVASVLSHLVKLGVGRVRPPRADWIGAASGYAFPSGHATAATAGYLSLALVTSSLIRGRDAPGRDSAWLPRAAWAGGIAMAALVGWSRLVLGVHWPTDVLAGWALGVMVVAIAVLFVRWPHGAAAHRGGRRDHRARRGLGPARQRPHRDVAAHRSGSAHRRPGPVRPRPARPRPA